MKMGMGYAVTVLLPTATVLEVTNTGCVTALMVGTTFCGCGCGFGESPCAAAAAGAAGRAPHEDPVSQPSEAAGATADLCCCRVGQIDVKRLCKFFPIHTAH